MQNKLCQDYIVPGWNDYVKQAHTEVRYYYILWRDIGKPKHGPVSELMRKSRLHFKHLLKQCQQREDMARADDMTISMQAKDSVSFVWKKYLKHTRKVYPMLLIAMVLMILWPYPLCEKYILNSC